MFCLLNKKSLRSCINPYNQDFAVLTVELNYRVNSPVSISATAKLNSRILWGFLSMEGFLTSTIQNSKLNKKEAAAITQNDTCRARLRLLLGGGFEMPVGVRVVALSMLVYLQIDRRFVRPNHGHKI